MELFEPIPKTPERKPNNSVPPNIKEERNRKRKASTTSEELRNATNTTILEEKVAEKVAVKLTSFFDRLEQKIDDLGMQIRK